MSSRTTQLLSKEETAALRAALEKRLQSPGKWQMLFDDDGQLVKSAADRLPGKPRFQNPTFSDHHKPKAAFVPYDAAIPAVHDWDVLEVFRTEGRWEHVPRFFVAGERAQYILDPRCVHVGILIAGGPAAGLNMVTDSIVKRHFALATQLAGEGRNHKLLVYGYRGGYVGLGEKRRFLLAPAESALAQASYPTNERVLFTDEWATAEGVRLKSLRGKSGTEDEQKQQAEAHAHAILEEKLDILYVVGGDGTLKWSEAVCRALKAIAPNKQLVVVGGPKTMDNDILFADVTFGFRTAVDNAAEFIRTIHTTAESNDRLGVIELFGAASGFVALHAGYVSGVADYVMIPERSPDENEVLEYLKGRMKKNDHAVLVVAEGALREFSHGSPQEKEEAFSNFLRRLRGEKFPLADVRARYLMRDTRPNSFDLDLCKYSGKLMVDTALAGFTNCVVNLWQGDYVLVPFVTATRRRREVATWSYYLQMLLDRERLSLMGSGRATCPPDATENAPGGAGELIRQLSGLCAEHFDDDGRQRIDAAIALACEAHGNHKRKHGAPYVEHPLRVAIRLICDFHVRECDSICAALLHDVLEDAGDSYQGAIAVACGEVALELVQVLTAPDFSQHPNQAEQNRLKAARVASGPPAAWIIKLADRIDNLHDAERLEDTPTNRTFWLRYQQDSLDYYVRLAENLGRSDVSTALADAMQALGRKIGSA